MAEKERVFVRFWIGSMWNETGWCDSGVIKCPYFNIEVRTSIHVNIIISFPCIYIVLHCKSEELALACCLTLCTMLPSVRRVIAGLFIDHVRQQSHASNLFSSSILECHSSREQNDRSLISTASTTGRLSHYNNSPRSRNSRAMKDYNSNQPMCIDAFLSPIANGSNNNIAEESSWEA